ncbi:MAG: DNA polymerase, partial [Clostridia bacterium]|nr:DNA polymerase [Clostridia bacterium]
MADKRRIFSIDLESFSDVDLAKCGVYRYVEGDFHILLFAYAFDDEEAKIVDLACGEQLPQEVVDAIFDDSIIKAAWNAQFERTCLSKYFNTRLSPDSWQCSMVWAASLSLPLKLKTAAEVLKTGEQKDDAGERLIKYFSVPCRPTKSNGGRTRNLPENAPEDWARFKEYCRQDVRTERAIRKRLERFPLPDSEWNHYHMDQRINDRGVMIDRDLVTQAIKCDLMLSEEMTKRAYELTGLENPNSVSQLKGWLEERGISVDTLGKKDVAAMIADLDKHSVDGEALEMMKLRLQMAKSSVKKYQAAERCICDDGRARGLFQFSGAVRTQRWSGRLIQLQNLPQNHIASLDDARELVKLGCFNMVESIYGNT